MKQFRPPFRAFTLIELIVVIAIILILAGLVLSTAGFIQKKAARARAEAEIAAITTALESYKTDVGDYPIASNGDPNNPTSTPGANGLLLTNLMPTTGKVYMPFNGTTATNGQILDPFGEPYGYVYGSNGSGTKNSNYFDLWSRVGSGTNTNVWEKNW